MASYVTNLPVNGVFNVTAFFGQSGKYWASGHKGIDITTSHKTLYSICDGEVTVVGWDPGGWGRYVSVRPDGFNRIRIIMCHMTENSVKVKKGQRVSRTTVLGTMGTTGKSTGVHVHVEMRIDNNSVDPSFYMLIPNKKATGLNSADFKFDASCQRAALEAVQEAFDKKTQAPEISSICTGDGALKRQIENLSAQLSQCRTELASTQKKIFEAKKALE